MSKTKNYYWDEAEKFVESVFENLKKGLIDKDEAKNEILESDVALDLIDINAFNIDEVIDNELMSNWSGNCLMVSTSKG